MEFYILSQVFVAFSYLTLAVSYYVKKRSETLLYSYIALIFNALAFSLLSAWTGFAMTIIAILRNSIFSIRDKFHKSANMTKFDIIILLGLILVITLFSIITFNGIFCLLSTFSIAIYTISIWQKNPVIYRWLGILASALYIAYHIYILSILGIILESCLLVFIVAKIVMQKNKKMLINND